MVNRSQPASSFISPENLELTNRLKIRVYSGIKYSNIIFKSSKTFLSPYQVIF